MDDALSKELLKTANQSGFPLQIGVRKEIERTVGDHGWKIVAEEHHWTHPGGGRGSFIDLIAEQSPFVFSLVIECKRVRSKDKAFAPSWTFLTPRDYTSTQHRLSGFMTRKLQRSPADDGPPQADILGWIDAIDFEPATLEAAYCVFEAQEEKNPAVERIADTLLPSVEAVGREWLTFSNVCRGEDRMFLPIIVTNAKLYTCTFDAETVSMVDGTLPHGELQEVPLVRFRKGLAMGQSGKRPARNFTDSNRREERTLLVANSASLANTLKQLRLTVNGNRTFGHSLLA